MRRRHLSILAASPRVIPVACLVLVMALIPSLSSGAESASPSPSPVAVPSPSAAAASVDPGASPQVDISPGPVETAWQPDFRVGDWELHKLPWEKRRLGSVAPIPAKTIGPADKKDVPLRPLGRSGAMVYNPTVLAQQGLKRLDAYQQTGKSVHRRVARNIAAVLDKISTNGKQRRWIPHGYSSAEEKLRPGWVNANSHGLVLSFFSRYHELFGTADKLQTAAELLPAFQQRPGDKRWFATVTEDGLLWLEHWPNGKHVHTLNAHLNAMFGLYDYWLETQDPVAEQYVLGAALTVREKLYRFRRKGRLSRYSLSRDLATVHYHRTHIEQLRVLARITGDKWFKRQADAFARDQRKWQANGRGRG